MREATANASALSTTKSAAQTPPSTFMNQKPKAVASNNRTSLADIANLERVEDKKATHVARLVPDEAYCDNTQKRKNQSSHGKSNQDTSNSKVQGIFDSNPSAMSSTN